MLDIATLLDPATGLVSDVQLTAPSREVEPFWRASATLACQHNQADQDPGGDTVTLVRCSTGACAITRADAVIRTAGEAVERMALHGPADDVATVAEMGDRALAFWTEEVPLADHPGARQLSWYTAHRIIDGRDYHVPAGLVEFPGSTADLADFDHGPSGAAAGLGYDDALRRALLEIVERDAVIVAWARQQYLLPVDLGRRTADHVRDPEWDTLQRVVAAVGRTGLEPVFAWVPSADGSVVTAVGGVRTTGGPPQLLSVGVKSATHPGRALVGAIQESFQLLGGLRLMRDTTTAPTVAIGMVTEEADRMRWLASRAGVDALESWLATDCTAVAGPQPDLGAASDIDGSASSLLDRLLADGLDPYVVDLSSRLPPRVQDLGWSVVKVIPVGYQPLRIDESRTFGWSHPRLRSLESRTGVPARLPPGEISRLPHPLP